VPNVVPPLSPGVHPEFELEVPVSISDVAIKRPVFTSMVALCLIVLGVMGLKRLGTDLFPDVSFPFVTVTTVYKGAGPGEIETQVVKPIEDAVAGISGVEKIHSFSRESAGVVMVQFKLGESLDRATQEVRDKVAAVVGKLPREADAPAVARFDIGAAPVLTYAASAKLSSQKLRKLIEDELQPALQQIDGVADVRVIGGDVREIQVDLDPNRVRAAGLSPLLLDQRLGAENVNVPAGHVALGPTEITVRSLGEFTNVDGLRALPIVSGANGARVRLDEVATVTDGVAERRTGALLDGRDAVILEVVKQSGSNTVQVADGVKQALETVGPAMGHDFKTSLIIDQSELIRENAKEVWIALIFGGLMAIVIILLFLLDPRGTFISSLALPTSVISTFFVMYVLGYSLNQMTLLALSLAIGLLIDDAVVVREAITHRLELGEEPMAAAAAGTRDVGLAVLATTFTLVAVFVPVAFMPGIVGQFFRQFGLTISVAVLISLFVSFTVDPMLSARLVKAHRPGQVRRENAVFAALRRGFERLENGYARLLGWVLDHKLATLGLVVLVLVATGFVGKKVGSEFVSAEDRGQFQVDLKLPDQSSYALTVERAQQATALLQKIPEVKSVYAVVGPQGEINKVKLRAITSDKRERKRGITLIKDEARGLLNEGLSATRVTLGDPPMIEGLGDFQPIIVRVMGPDLKVVASEARWMAEQLGAVVGTADVKVDDNPPKPELQASLDRTRAGEYGLTAGLFGQQLRLALYGDVPAKLREGKDETDIRVRLAGQDRADPQQLGNLDLVTPSGRVQLSDVAQITQADGVSIIEHENRQRQIALTSGLSGAAPLGQVVADFRARLAVHPLPPGYSVAWDGQVKTFDEQNQAFGAAFLLAFIFIFMVLASQFESLKHPFTIMVSLPLALVGALLGLLVTGNHLSMGAMIGVILLMGLVTKNAILLVDGALQNLRAGDDLRTALLKAGPRRLRPILMTSAAMALGMLPTALGRGTGSEFRSPMAIAVIGGVITSTFLTLLVVPVVFYGVERLSLSSLLFWRRSPKVDPDPDPLEKDATASLAAGGQP
jgi:HAE1 family hydrophobic/amphiphilic exporter-1